MSYIPLIEPATTTGAYSQTFNQIQGAFGTIPNMFKAIPLQLLSFRSGQP